MLIDQTWFGSILALVGIVLSAVGIPALVRSRRRLDLSCIRWSRRLIGGLGKGLPERVKVLYDNRKVDRLYSTTIVLWNSGANTLNGQDIVHSDPLQAVFKDGRILSAQIAKASREVNKFRISANASKPTLKITYDFLDPKDGATIEILHTSSEPDPEVGGTIKGLPKGLHVLSPNAREATFSRPRSFISAFARTLTFPIVSLVLALSLVAAILFLPEKSFTVKNESLFSPTLFRIIATVIGITYCVPFALYLKHRRRFPKVLKTE